MEIIITFSLLTRSSWILTKFCGPGIRRGPPPANGVDLLCIKTTALIKNTPFYPVPPGAFYMLREVGQEK